MEWDRETFDELDLENMKKAGISEDELDDVIHRPK